VNVIDLARVDAKYLAVEDVSFQKAANAAAEDIAKLGGGKVFVAMSAREGGQLVGESLRLHLAETADAVTGEGVRFILASGATLRDNKSLSERWQRGELTPAGFYSLSAKQGVRKAPQASAALVLLQAKGVPVPSKVPASPDRAAQLLTLLSVLMTAGVLVWAVVPLLKNFRWARTVAAGQ
jgi:hypothetical protein